MNIAVMRKMIEAGRSDEEIRTALAESAELTDLESATAWDEERAAHGERDDLVLAVSQYGGVNDAGERRGAM